MGVELESLTCAICFRMYYDPITAPCNHSYCRDCIIKSFKKNNKLCPLCRLELHEWDLSTQPVSATIQQALKSEKFLEIYKQREKEGQEERLAEQLVLRVKISIGNLHQDVPSVTGGNNHKWTFFLLSHEGEDLTKYIKHVVVHLHPTFNPSKVVMSEEPFMFTRTGWGVFAMRVEVHYHAHFEKRPDEFTHILSFRQNGNATTYELAFDRRKFPDSDAAENSENSHIGQVGQSTQTE